jgi:hypothetical protein
MAGNVQKVMGGTIHNITAFLMAALRTGKDKSSQPFEF